MLTATQLFTPGQSGVGITDTTPAPGTWYSLLLSTAGILGLPTTSWQPGAPERTILAIAAVALAREDVIISTMSQGGFLDFAASGTVTSVTTDGVSVTQPVTPDPSIPSQNPTGAPGWLDALGQSFFDEERLQATYASGQLAIANTTAGTLTYGVGIYHVANVATGATYSNTVALSVPTSAIAGTGGVVTAVAVGTTTTITTQSAHGLAPGDTVYFLNSNGVIGLNGSFAIVSSTPTASTFTTVLTTTGTWTSGGNVYKCTIAQMSADARGIASNAGAGQVSVTVTQITGVYVDNVAAWSASNFESNVAYANRCRLKLGALSPNGPSQAYDYYALTAQSILAAQTPPITLTNGAISVATTFANPQTQVVECVVASSTPAGMALGDQITPGCAQLGVTGATNTTPITITTASAHGLSSADAVIVSGVLGNTAANIGTTINVTGASTFTLDGSVGNGAYLGGGSVEGGDLGQIDALIQANVVPDGQIALTVSALAFPVAIAAAVVVPQAYVQTYTVAAQAALQALIVSYPIGGNIPPGESAGTIPYSAVEGALFEAGVLVLGAVSFVRQVTSLTINGLTVDVTYPAPEYQAILSAPSISVSGV